MNVIQNANVLLFLIDSAFSWKFSVLSLKQKNKTMQITLQQPYSISGIYGFDRNYFLFWLEVLSLNFPTFLLIR